MREQIAEYAHESWSAWMVYLFSMAQENEDGSVTIPPEKVLRWKRQMGTPYPDLPEGEKESDRKQADKIIRIFLSLGKGIALYFPEYELKYLNCDVLLGEEGSFE